MTGDDPGSKPVPVVGLPSEFMTQRGHGEGGIGGPSGDDYVRAASESLNDWLRPDVRVR